MTAHTQIQTHSGRQQHKANKQSGSKPITLVRVESIQKPTKREAKSERASARERARTFVFVRKQTRTQTRNIEAKFVVILQLFVDEAKNGRNLGGNATQKAFNKMLHIHLTHLLATCCSGNKIMLKSIKLICLFFF